MVLGYRDSNFDTVEWDISDGASDVELEAISLVLIDGPVSLRTRFLRYTGPTGKRQSVLRWISSSHDTWRKETTKKIESKQEKLSMRSTKDRQGRSTLRNLKRDCVLL